MRQTRNPMANKMAVKLTNAPQPECECPLQPETQQINVIMDSI